MDYDFTYTGAEIQTILDTGKKLKDSGYIFLGVATPSTNPGTPTQKVYYEAKQAGTYTNFGGVVLPDGISLLIWNGSWTSETVMSGDGGVFDISVYKSSGGTLATFADLSAALDGGNNVPVGVRKGGMSVKFVQSSDNKYVQYRLRSKEWTTNISYWVDADDEIDEIDQVLNGSYVAVDKTPVTGDLIVYEGLESGHEYTITIVDMDANSIADTTAVLLAQFHNTTGDHTISALYGSIHYKNYTWKIEVPNDADSAWIKGKNNIHVNLIIKDDADKGLVGEVEKMSENVDSLNGSVQQNTEDIGILETSVETLNNDMYGGQSSVAVESTQLFLKDGSFIETSTEHDGILFPVNSGQRVQITAAINNTQCKCCFTNTKPALGTADLMEESPDSYRYGADYTCPNDGWCYVAKSYSAVSSGATLYSTITIDGQSIFTPIETMGIKDKVDELWNGGHSTLASEDQHDAFEYESEWWVKEKLLDGLYKSQEDTTVNALISTVQQRATQVGQGKLQIAIISDTHGTGAFSNWWDSDNVNRPATCFRSIAAFNRIASVCDIAFHGGDISCDYGTSRTRILQYMKEVMQLFRFDKPLFVTKGNHDVNYDIHIEADMSNLDWTNVNYYKRNYSTFTQVTENTWRGERLYTIKQEKVSDAEFRNAVQHWLCPTNAVWSTAGAYYYYDISNVKIRVIVANCYPVDSNYEDATDAEYQWFATEALNFSSKESDKSNWNVILLRHMEATSFTDLANCINAFRTGGVFTYKGTELIDFGEVNGGAMTFIANIHGHEHGYCFGNGAGYLDIGVDRSFVYVPDLGNANKYGLSVFTIDTANSIIYVDTIEGGIGTYNYSTGKLLIPVGGRFKVAASGIKNNMTISSTDRSKADLFGSWKKQGQSNKQGLYTDAMAQTLPHGESPAYSGISAAEADGWAWTASQYIEAVSVGDVTINVSGTGSDGTLTYQYPITVVASN